jgi:cytochrome c-type biogenesis protein CcmH/NrfG
METESNPPGIPSPLWRPAQVIVMSAICLVIGVVLGYFLRGSAPIAASAPAAMTGAPPSAMPAAAPASADASKEHPKLSLDDMKRMADAKAAPLLAKLKTNPNDADALNQLGILYRATHQFKEAQGYFEKSLEINPKNVDARVDLASCLYYTGDANGALAQLNKALTVDPKHAGALMNLGIIKMKSNNDAAGAIAAWEKLLKLNPDFPQKDAVQRMIEQARQGSNS